MKVLSFDVGIVNLAYCIMEKTNNDTEFDITEWNIINLDTNKITCSYKGTRKNANICGKNAKFAYGTLNLCKKHTLDVVKEYENSIARIGSDNGFCEIGKCKNICEHIFKEDINEKEKKVCTIHLDKLKKPYLPKKIKNQNSNYKSANSLANILFTIFDSEKDIFLNVDKVLIESQPGLINPTMKSIASMIYSYFTIRGIIDNKTIDEVLFIKPDNKLKISKISDDIIGEAKTKKGEYIVTKELGKVFCKSLVENNEKYMQFMNGHKKTDDLCDSFLQGFYYLFNRDGNIPVKYVKILDDVNNKLLEKAKLKEKTDAIKKLKEKKSAKSKNEFATENIIATKKPKEKKTKKIDDADDIIIL